MDIARTGATPLDAMSMSTGARTAVSFDVDARKHAVTVNVVDRQSGEVLRQWVMGRRDQVTTRASGRIDVMV